MFYVPERPGWSKDRLFLTDGGAPMLVAHVTASEPTSAPVGRWAFSHPRDFQHLLEGISGSPDAYTVTHLNVLIYTGTGSQGLSFEEVLDVTTNESDADQRVYLIRTIGGNSYLLGDELLSKTALNVTIYQHDARSLPSWTSH